MENFPAALAYVHDTLRDLQERGVVLSAALTALEPLRRPLAASELPPTLAAPSASVTTSPRASAVPAGANRLDAAPVPARRPGPAVPTVPNLPPSPPPPPVAPLPFTVPASGSKAERLAALREPALACVRCPHLAASRTQVVFGTGNPEAELMFVGEAPGEDEDLQGEPFVGKAGQLLTKIIEAMGFAREDVYIANVLKCRPNMPAGQSGNRKPTPAEMMTCLPYLEQQIAIVQPKVLVGLGATAMEGLTKSVLPMGQLRSKWHDFRGTPLMATYHPSYLLRNQSLTEKRKVWDDLLLVLTRLGREITEKQQGYFLSKG